MKKSYLIALVTATLALLWILSGQTGPSDTSSATTPQDQSAAETPPDDDALRVRVRHLEHEEHTYSVRATGRTQASRRVILRGEVEGTVAEILHEKGTAIKQGDVIARLEERDRQARLDEAKERLIQREIEFNAAKTLETQGFNSRIRLAQARADLEAARAMVRQAEIDLANLEITAPFDGVIYDQMIETGDLVRVGDELFALADLDPVEVRAFISERKIAHLHTGKIAHATFMNGGEADGTVSFIAPVADAQTRTFPVEISIPNPQGAILEGLTTQIDIPADPLPVHRISPAILTLDDEGTVGVKLVDETNRVRFAPIEIIADMPDGMLIGGLPDKVTVITIGQDFVVPNQLVEPVAAENDEDGLL